MAALLTLLVVLFLSLLVVRIATEALTLTGLSRQTARFQAQSAWSGTGFTTSESESVMRHPVRRRIISLLILVRTAGLVTAASTLMLSFVNVEQRGQGLRRVAVLVLGLGLLWAFARSQWVDRHLARLMTWVLKRYTDIDTRDYAGLLHLAGEYAVMEHEVKPGGWMDGRTLEELKLMREGILVLGLVRPDGTYQGAPRGSTRVRAGERIILYGRSPLLAGVARRRADASGDAAHREAVEEQRRVEQQDGGAQDSLH